MVQKFTRRRLKENEVIFRDTNRSVQQFIEEETGTGKMIVSFYCECSRPDCRERIGLTTEAYRELHPTKKHFIVVSGHEIPAIEKIYKRDHGFNVVEKYGTVPSIEEVNLALSKLTV